MSSINETQHITSNEEFVRNAYAIAEVKDIAGWIDCFVPDGVFVDNSIAVTYRGPEGVLANLGAMLQPLPE